LRKDEIGFDGLAEEKVAILCDTLHKHWETDPLVVLVINFFFFLDILLE